MIDNSIFISNKYLKLYNSIINKAKLRPIYKKAQRRINYVEDHHILPKSLGGLGSIENLVQLSAREHYICHQLLPKFTSGLNRAKMLFAFEMMNKMGSRINSRTFERYKLVFSENQKKRIVSQETRDKIGNAHRGMKRSEEAKRNISESQKGKIISEETKAKLRGKIVSEETRRKMSLSSKGRKGHQKIILKDIFAEIKLL